MPYVVTKTVDQQNFQKIHDFNLFADCNHPKPKIHHQIFQTKPKFLNSDTNCSQCVLRKMVKFATPNFAKFSQILKIFALHESFDGGHQD